MSNYCKIKTNNNEQWHLERSKGIGGSDAGAIMGVNPWRTPLAVYLDKVGELPRKPHTDATYFGTKLEPMIADVFAEKHPEMRVRNMNPTICMFGKPFIRGNLDRVLTVRETSERFGLEIKTANAFAKDEWFDEWGAETVPASYWVQVQHYMLITGWTQFYVAALIGGQEYLERIVMRDESFIAELLEEETRFWNENVRQKKQPEWDGSKIASEYLKAKYPTATKGKEILLTEAGIEAAENYLRVKADVATLKAGLKLKEEQLEAYKQALAAEIGDAETAYGGGFTIKYNSVNIKEKTTAAYSYRRMSVKGI